MRHWHLFVFAVVLCFITLCWIVTKRRTPFVKYHELLRASLLPTSHLDVEDILTRGGCDRIGGNYGTSIYLWPYVGQDVSRKLSTAHQVIKVVDISIDSLFFDAEVKALTRLKGANITADIVDHWVTLDPLRGPGKAKGYIVMEFIIGQNLLEYARSNTTNMELWNVLANKIHKMHNMGVASGDLHVLNVMVRGEDKDVIIIDFGEFAKVVRGNKSVRIAGVSYPMTFATDYRYLLNSLELHTGKQEQVDAIFRRYIAL